jgi:predicted lipid-binding transport protein (Tim44 family)
MTRKSKKQDTETAAYAGIEAALEEKIRRIKGISDPIEQLFQFKALKDSGEAAYDKKKVLPWGADDKAELKFLKITNRGFFTGLLGGIALGIGLASTAVLTGGVAVFAWLGFWAAGTAVGALIGRKRRNSLKSSPEQKHARKMYLLANRIDDGFEAQIRAFKKLTSNFQNEWNMNILARSSHFEEIKKAFPDIAPEFNRQAKAAQIQAKADKIQSDWQAKIAAQQDVFLARHHLLPG